jgi:ssDNA-binding Zn-finger/Zn-ribbon topoisomerase 1
MFQMIGMIGQVVVPVTCLVGAAVGYLKQRQRTESSASADAKAHSAGSRVSGSPTMNSAEHAAGCPVCGSPMVRRQARRGANAGGHFYGCSRYPACKGTRAE